MRWTLDLPIATHSLNGTQGQHWSKVRKMKAEIGTALMVALCTQERPTLATGKRRLTIVRHGKGSLDPDNLVGSCKFLIDALRFRGLLVDDTEGAVELVVSQVVDRRARPHTLVMLQELPIAPG